MEVLASYYTDAGNVKSVNQDSLSIKVVNSPHGRIIFAIVCDGMGGLKQGELASKEVVVSFDQWFQMSFARMIVDDAVTEEQIYSEWKQQIEEVNQRLQMHTAQSGEMLGTTMTVLLIYEGRYYVCHVGDSRIYEIRQQLQLLTEDHTLVNQEVQMGLITKEQAKKDSRRSVLLQCVGASEVVMPQLISGNIVEDTTFILCSDGFVHEISEKEIHGRFRPEVMSDKEDIAGACKKTAQLVMSRGERDNITVIGIVLKNVGN